MANQRGKFIVIDGMDGSGKGTQIDMLRERLKEYPAIFTREPGGSGKADQIRDILLDRNSPSSTPLCDFFLFWSARASHLEDTVLPSLAKGISVISDRFDSSTYAFQICGEDHPEWEDMFWRVRDQLRLLLGERYSPDLYIFLDLDERIAYKRRAADKCQEKTRFDVKPVEYHRRVRAGFTKWSERFTNCTVVDAQQSIENVARDIWAIISNEFDL